MSDKIPSTLTQFERLILANQLRLLEYVDPQNKEGYREQRTIVEHGYTLLYSDVFSGVYPEELPIEECRYIFDVLDMYRDLHHSYKALSDKQGIKTTDVKFKGFDGNNESARWGFTKFLHEQGKWTESLSHGAINSHSMVTMSLYPKMLAEYEQVKSKQGYDFGKMSATDIKQMIG